MRFILEKEFHEGLDMRVDGERRFGLISCKGESVIYQDDNVWRSTTSHLGGKI